LLPISQKSTSAQTRSASFRASSTQRADLVELSAVDQLCDGINDRPVGAVLANAGRDLGKSFLDQDFDDILRVIEANNVRGSPIAAWPAAADQLAVTTHHRVEAGSGLLN
jgi:short-subunit dehydrogenase